MSLNTCPECGAESAVKDSRQNENECRRRYECKRGHRYTTIEFVVKARKGVNSGARLRNLAGSMERIQDTADALRAIAGQLAPPILRRRGEG